MVYCMLLTEKLKNKFSLLLSVIAAGRYLKIQDPTLCINFIAAFIILTWITEPKKGTLSTAIPLFMEVMLVGGSGHWGPEMMQFSQPYRYSVRGRLKFRLPECSLRTQTYEKQCIKSWLSAQALELDRLGLILAAAQPLLWLTQYQ